MELLQHQNLTPTLGVTSFPTNPPPLSHQPSLSLSSSKSIGGLTFFSYYACYLNYAFQLLLGPLGDHQIDVRINRGQS